MLEYSRGKRTNAKTVPASASGQHIGGPHSGSQVFISGQVSIDASGDLVGEGDREAQGEQTLSNVEAAREAGGMIMSDVAKIPACPIDDDPAADASVRLKGVLGRGPASGTVLVDGLVNPSFAIVTDAIAVAS